MEELANPGQAKKIARIVSMSLTILIIGIGAAVYISIKHSSYKPNSFGEWQTPSVNRYFSFTGSKGPVVWELLDQSRSPLDSSRHFLRIIDPVKNHLISETQFEQTTTLKDNFNFNKRIGYDFLQVNDTLFNGSEDGGLKAFDLYSGKQILSNSYFEKKYPELKDGIAKVDSKVYNAEFVITTKMGDEYHYYPLKHLLRTSKEADNSYRTDTITRPNFYFSKGPKSELYLITKRESPNENAVISDIYLQGYLNNDRYYERYFHSLKKLGNGVYPCPQRLISNPDFIIMAYMSDFSKEAQLVIEKINAEGKTIWQNKDTALKFFTQDFSGSNLLLRFHYNPSQIVFYHSSALHKSLGIDLNAGKTTFIHSQGYQLQ